MDQNEKGWCLAVTIATTIAFFAMVGFEDSVNMVEETKNPEKIFPKMMFSGLGAACAIYILVVVAVVAVLPLDYDSGDEGILLHVVELGAPTLPIDEIFPYLTVFAVANTALINMLMASRLIYGMARQRVLPNVLGWVLPGRRSPWTAIVFCARTLGDPSAVAIRRAPVTLCRRERAGLSSITTVRSRLESLCSDRGR